jgi:hypothetical protein
MINPPISKPTLVVTMADLIPSPVERYAQRVEEDSAIQCDRRAADTRRQVTEDERQNQKHDPKEKRGRHIGG